jgi:hypothetical protein
VVVLVEVQLVVLETVMAALVLIPVEIMVVVAHLLLQQ